MEKTVKLFEEWESNGSTRDQIQNIVTKFQHASSYLKSTQDELHVKLSNIEDEELTKNVYDIIEIAKEKAESLAGDGMQFLLDYDEYASDTANKLLEILQKGDKYIYNLLKDLDSVIENETLDEGIFKDLKNLVLRFLIKAKHTIKKLDDISVKANDVIKAVESGKKL